MAEVPPEALFQAAVEHLLADVPERRVPEVVAEPDRLDEILVQPQRPRDRARDRGHLERVGEPRAVVVAARRHEHLRLVRQPAERLAVHDPVAVALERRAQRAVLLGVRPRAPDRSAPPAARASCSSCAAIRSANAAATVSCSLAMLTGRSCQQPREEPSALAVPVAAHRHDVRPVVPAFHRPRVLVVDRRPAARRGQAPRSAESIRRSTPCSCSELDVGGRHEAPALSGLVRSPGRGRCPSRAPRRRARRCRPARRRWRAPARPSRAPRRRSAGPRPRPHTIPLTERCSARRERTAGIRRTCAWCSSVAEIARSTCRSAGSDASGASRQRPPSASVMNA